MQWSILSLRARAIVSEGAQVMLFSTDPRADLHFARELFGLAGAESGGGWLLFALPPGQSGIDDHGGDDSHQIYLECRDLDQAIAVMARRGVEAGTATSESWGRWVSIALPGGGRVRLHEAGGKPSPPWQGGD